MVLDGARREVQTLGDGRVSEAVGEQPQHLELARGQLGVVAARARARPTRQATRASFTEATRHDRGGAASAELLQLVESTTELVFFAGVGTRESGLVRTTCVVPERRGGRPVSSELG